MRCCVYTDNTYNISVDILLTVLYNISLYRDTQVAIYRYIQIVYRYISNTDPVTCVSFSHDGHCVLASTLDNKLLLLDKDSGDLLNRYC